MTGHFIIAPLKQSGIQQLIELVNSAYRGEDSKKGWTTEADIIAGSLRTDLADIKLMLKKTGAIILTCINENNTLGCVFLQKQKSGLYLGMLSVSPLSQGMGIGKKLMAAAEDHAKKLYCDHVFMTVIDVRHELIAWYERHGYVQTGETRPFHTDENFGVPRKPLQFIVLKKTINLLG